MAFRLVCTGMKGNRLQFFGISVSSHNNTVWFKESHDRYAGTNPISNLAFPLRLAQNYLDDTVEIINRVQRGNMFFSSIDFLYFSAVTITTLGYGDILPNSNIVRLLVMMEALFGVFFAGIFVSSLFIKNRQK